MLSEGDEEHAPHSDLALSVSILNKQRAIKMRLYAGHDSLLLLLLYLQKTTRC